MAIPFGLGGGCKEGSTRTSQALLGYRALHKGESRVLGSHVCFCCCSMLPGRTAGGAAHIALNNL
jgi:hypothetical protein